MSVKGYYGAVGEARAFTEGCRRWSCGLVCLPCGCLEFLTGSGRNATHCTECEQ